MESIPTFSTFIADSVLFCSVHETPLEKLPLQARSCFFAGVRAPVTSFDEPLEFCPFAGCNIPFNSPPLLLLCGHVKEANIIPLHCLLPNPRAWFPIMGVQGLSTHQSHCLYQLQLRLHQASKLCWNWLRSPNVKDAFSCVWNRS